MSDVKEKEKSYLEPQTVAENDFRNLQLYAALRNTRLRRSSHIKGEDVECSIGSNGQDIQPLTTNGNRSKTSLIAQSAYTSSGHELRVLFKDQNFHVYKLHISYSRQKGGNCYLWIR